MWDIVERLNKPWPSGQGIGLTTRNFQVHFFLIHTDVDMYVFILHIYPHYLKPHPIGGFLAHF